MRRTSARRPPPKITTAVFTDRFDARYMHFPPGGRSPPLSGAVSPAAQPGSSSSSDGVNTPLLTPLEGIFSLPQVIVELERLGQGSFPRQSFIELDRRSHKHLPSSTNDDAIHPKVNPVYRFPALESKPDVDRPIVLHNPKRKPSAPSTFDAPAFSKRFTPGHQLDPGFVSRYTPGHELGVGGHGFVLSVYDRLKKRECAVKFILKKDLPTSAWCHLDGERMLLECRIMLLLNHPNIINLLDYFEDRVYVYLVMEMAGTPWTKNSPALLNLSVPAPSNLAISTFSPPRQGLGARRPSHDLFECLELLPSKRFSEEDARYIFFQLVRVVDYLASLGIYHRDIKDENLLIDEHLTIKLIDFGAAALEDPSKPPPEHSKFFGTLAYAPPEITLRQSYFLEPMEVWTMGILLVYLLTGRSPFQEPKDALEGRIGLYAASGAAAILSVPCMEVIRSCLHPNPEKRATIKELLGCTWVKDCRPRYRSA